MSDRRTVHRVCPFCEATCGLAVEVEGDAIITVRGDKEDPFSRGYICPKAYGLKELHQDPDRLRARMATCNGDMVLIGRRDLRCSNSFMHNLPALVKGRDRCTLQVSREDAGRMNLTDGSAARITSRVGSVVAPVEVTEDLMPGVVSLPHGWGHDVDESQLVVAKAHAGVNTNVLTDDRAYDEASGTAVLFGTPVTIEPLTQPREQRPRFANGS